MYKRPRQPKVMNFQNVNGMAKEYQVKQLLAVIAELPADEGEDESV